MNSAVTFVDAEHRKNGYSRLDVNGRRVRGAMKHVPRVHVAKTPDRQSSVPDTGKRTTALTSTPVQNEYKHVHVK